jgi:hypothetical protein
MPFEMPLDTSMKVKRISPLRGSVHESNDGHDEYLYRL